MYKYTYLLSLLLFAACTQNNSPVVEKEYISTDSISYEIIADTITYDVIIKTIDESDKWQNIHLQYLKKKEYIDKIFELVYSNKLMAYDFFSGGQLTSEEVREIESSDDYSRDLIGKIQFTEKWLFNYENQIMKKEVISIVFGYEYGKVSGEIRYKPVFKIYTN